MKKILTTLVCIILGFAATYLIGFDDADFTQLSTLCDFVISGAISALFIKVMWAFVSKDIAATNSEE